MNTLTRTDRAYCRKWTQAHRKGKPTAEITREWLAVITGPPRPKPKPTPIPPMAWMDAIMRQIDANSALAKRM